MIDADDEQRKQDLPQIYILFFVPLFEKCSVLLHPAR
jgi:hypothetical protein